MKLIRCIAVDDEPLALDLISYNIKKISFLNCVATFNSAEKAITFLKNNPVDLIFLDIQMPGMSGINFAKTIKSSMIIFTTAFDEYALDGFEVSALDYVLKPIMFPRFEKACYKAKEYFDLKENSVETSAIILVRSENQTVKIFLNDIVYIEGLKDYVKIFTKQGEKPILTRTNLKGIGDLLPGQEFKRVHKSYIVNTDKVTSIGTDFLNINSVRIPVGETFKKDIKNILSKK